MHKFTFIINDEPYHLEVSDAEYADLDNFARVSGLATPLDYLYWSFQEALKQAKEDMPSNSRIHGLSVQTPELKFVPKRMGTSAPATDILDRITPIILALFAPKLIH